MQHRIFPDIVREQRLATLAPDASVTKAVALMVERHIGAVMIVEGDRLVGIFTERDVVSRVVHARLDPKSTLLSEVMTRDPDTLSPSNTAAQALILMRERGYRHLPVVDGARILGIVSVRDLFAAVTEELEEDLKQRDALLFDTGYGSG